jgi:uncharacterized membrane protein YedE/YeeE
MGFMPVFANAADPIPGPYELQGSLLAVGLFIFLFGIVITKFSVVRIISSTLAALCGIVGAIVYYINQTSVGNEVVAGVMAVFVGGFIGGIALVVIWIRKLIIQKKIADEVKTKASDPTVKKRFED